LRADPVHRPPARCNGLLEPPRWVYWGSWRACSRCVSPIGRCRILCVFCVWIVYCLDGRVCLICKWDSFPRACTCKSLGLGPCRGRRPHLAHTCKSLRCRSRCRMPRWGHSCTSHCRPSICRKFPTSCNHIAASPSFVSGAKLSPQLGGEKNKVYCPCPCPVPAATPDWANCPCPKSSHR